MAGSSVAVSMLSSKESRQRWFMIMDRKRFGRLDRSDLLHFAPKFDLELDKASALFDRLDSDNDGFLSEADWNRVAALLAYDGLVRAQSHPMYMAYFRQRDLGALPLERLREIMASKGLNPEMLDKPDEMLPLNPTDVSNKPAPPAALPPTLKDSTHLIAPKPSFRSGRDPVDLPQLPYCPAHLRPRARPGGPAEAPVGPMQPMKWASLAMAAIDEDRPGTLRHALKSPVFDLAAVVKGGKHGTPFGLGPVFSFFVETHFRREKVAAMQRLDAIMNQEGKYRLPNEYEAIQQQAVKHIRYGGGPGDDKSECLFETVVLGDTLLHLAARAFSPEVASSSFVQAAILSFETPVGNLRSIYGKTRCILSPPPHARLCRKAVDTTVDTTPRGGVGEERGAAGSHISGAAAAAAASSGSRSDEKEEEPGGGKVATRWRERKRRGKQKLSWLEKCLEEMLRGLTGELEATAEISNSRVRYLSIVGGELTPWEANRLEAKDHLADLAEQAGQLLQRVQGTDPTAQLDYG
eukprot:CAMPEP_0171684240 /NCGR_PEP_ID=MMETSP0991-20121206/1570_1 /TAXON_ID=483369 /ORGANISM="non described non described, Strain CCMP2098" /LENGTH=521 /DNA_ID=CAMNT_0012271729 /DNA_START=115 /DNA_END=1677 /DNA_ORIENTATION=-